MKRLIFAAFAAATLASCNSTPGLYGNFQGFDTDTVIVNGNVLPYFDNVFSDTLIVASDGSFSYTLPVEGTAVVEIVPDGAAEAFQLFMSKDSRVEISASKDTAGNLKMEVLADAFNKGIKAFNDSLKPFNARIDEVAMNAQMAYMTGDKALTDSLVEIYNGIISEQTDYVKEYFIRNPHAPEAPYVYFSTPIDSAETFAAALSEQARNGIMSAMIDLRLKDAKETKLKRQAQQNIKVGAQAPDFTLTDIDGEQVSLSSFAGKTVILDFWGTWCGWCIKGIPDLKAAAEKYGDSIVILSVDCNDSDEQWRKGVEAHGLDWVNVRQDNDMPSETKPTVLYNVNGFPTKLIISTEGIIENITVGEDPKFYDELARIVGK